MAHKAAVVLHLGKAAHAAEHHLHLLQGRGKADGKAGRRGGRLPVEGREALHSRRKELGESALGPACAAFFLILPSALPFPRAIIIYPFL